MAERHHFEESEEMYLKSLYELGRTQDPVPVTVLAERLGITTVSASEMVRRLQARKLVQHKPYKGARLTPDGEMRAIAVLRRHRLWERFLTDRLGMGWVEAHDAACHLEHAANEQVVDALDSFLEFPDTCPHGNSIPRSGVERTRAEEHPLNRLKIGDRAKVLRVRDEGAALLAYLEGQGLKPGQGVELVGIAPFDGPRTLRLGGREAVIGREVAEHIMVAMEGPRA
jgi:DtxR family Mn-dependent transcriptional regulator